MSDDGREWLRLASVGTHLLAATLVGFAIGHQLLDPWFGTYPVFTAVFSLIGIAAGFLNLYREVQILDRAEAERHLQENTERTHTEKDSDSNDIA
ncbi:AtpZ/AtpI family protein [Acanthopleuribacter pedis]|uniref:AtpZ/AtpI family protein n=1 Tax=Acanthopleuribacter pedis TaxID=442870 RepID=A0A8J7Q9B3_9BACT|nr:AtpZ/AtpI family protein [Acanthopleuribacter pedis]